MKKMIKYAALVVLALGLAFTPVQRSDASVGLCDPQQSKLCQGLVEWYDFEQGPPAVFGSYANTMLRQGDSVDYISLGTGPTGTNYVKLSGASYGYLAQPRVGGFTGGRWTVSLWTYVPASGWDTAKYTTLFSTRRGVSGVAAAGFLVQLKYATGWKVNTYCWDDETGTSLNAVNTTALAVGWHMVTISMSPYGPYGKSKIRIAIDGGAFVDTTMSYLMRASVMDFTLGHQDGLACSSENMAYLDGFGIWAREFDANDVTANYNSGAGMDFPFY